MDLISNLAIGFEATTTLSNLGFCLLGTLIGSFVGVLPGLGPIATIAILLPVTFGMPSLSALIMLAGLYYGAQYGGSTTAILLNLPGETSSVVTCMDGYRMAQKGRAGSALAIAALGSFFAGCVATVFIAAFAPALAAIADSFGSPEYFALMLFGLTASIIIAHGSIVKAGAMVLMGLLLGLVGTDPTSGLSRFTLGFPSLLDGIDIVPVAMGLFGLAEILTNLEKPPIAGQMSTASVGSLWPNREERRQAWPAAVRGTGLGSLLGLLPGGGAVLASFAAYVTEKKVARDPSRFGRGAIEGVAGPESANNAAAQTSFIPLLTLGIPSTPTMAVMMAALTIQGIAPGTAIITQRPDLFWGIVCSMWIANLMLVVINLPLIGLWVRLLKIPYQFLVPGILLLCCVGVYSVSLNTFSLAVAAIFAIFGYVCAKLGCEGAPFLLGFVLGPLVEANFRRSMLISNGDPSIFITHPISAALLVATLAMIVIIVLPSVRGRRAEVFVE